MTSDERRPRRKTLVFWLLPLALVVAGSVAWVLLHSSTSAAPHPTTLHGSGSSAQVSAPAPSGSNGNTDPATGCNGSGSCTGHDHTFGVTVGTVTGLYPGATRALPVTYSNPNPFGIRVVSASVQATLLSSSRGIPACASSDLVTSTYADSTGIPVAANRTVATTFAVGLRSTAPNSCKQASWKLTVTAQATK